MKPRPDDGDDVSHVRPVSQVVRAAMKPRPDDGDDAALTAGRNPLDRVAAMKPRPDDGDDAVQALRHVHPVAGRNEAPS